MKNVFLFVSLARALAMLIMCLIALSATSDAMQQPPCAYCAFKHACGHVIAADRGSVDGDRTGSRSRCGSRSKENVAVQDLPYAVLRDRLVAQGQVLIRPPPDKKVEAKRLLLHPGRIAPRHRARRYGCQAGRWVDALNGLRLSIGSGYGFNGSKGCARRWQSDRKFSHRKTGVRHVSGVNGLLCPRDPRNNVPVTISNGSNETTLTVDQTTPLLAASTSERSVWPS